MIAKRVYVVIKSGMWSSDGTEDHIAHRTAIIGVYTDDVKAREVLYSLEQTPGWYSSAAYIETTFLDPENPIVA